MFNECELNGQSERCGPNECSLFWCGDCKDPGLPLDHMDLSTLEKAEWQELQEVYPETYELFYANFKKEKVIIMESKIETSLRVQAKDRKEASVKVMTLIDKLSNKTGDHVLNEHSIEVFSEVVMVPIRVTCVDTNGRRQVFLNASSAGGTELAVLVSKEFIECFSNLSVAVDKLDAELGCENISELL